MTPSALRFAVVSNLHFSQTGIPVVLPATIVCVGALIASARLGRLRLASVLLPPVLLAASMYFLLIRDGVHDTGVVLITGTLFIGGILMRRRAFVMLTIAAIVVILGTGYAEITGSLQNRFSSFTDIRYLIGICLVLLVIAITAHFVAESLLRSLREVGEKSAALGESEARLAKMIEASPEAITIASVEDGTFIAVNPAGQRLCGYTREEMIGNSAVAMGFYADPEERQRIVADLRRNEVVHGREVRLRHKNGELRDILMS